MASRHDDRSSRSGPPYPGYGEYGYAHVPGQRWAGGYGGYAGERPPGRHDVTGYGDHGSDMGMGAPADHRGADELTARASRGPHYGKGPKGYKRSDTRTRDEVCEAIAHQGLIDASDVEVSVEDSVVTLKGTVAQRHHKRALEQLVERVRGVEDVHNELRLQRAAAEKEPSQRAAPMTETQPSGDHQNGKVARS